MLQKPDEGIPTPTIIECNKSACPPAWQHGQSGSSRGIHAGKGDRSVNPKKMIGNHCANPMPVINHRLYRWHRFKGFLTKLQLE